MNKNYNEMYFKMLTKLKAANKELDDIKKSDALIRECWRKNWDLLSGESQ